MTAAPTPFVMPPLDQLQMLVLTVTLQTPDWAMQDAIEDARQMQLAQGMDLTATHLTFDRDTDETVAVLTFRRKVQA